MTAPLRLATRKSPLALRQAEWVRAALEAVEGPGAANLVAMDTRADIDLVTPIEAFAGRGVFVTEIERAVLEGRADVAVHSAKDLPSSSPPSGLVLACVPVRADPRDCLVGRRLDELGAGALIATGSARRRAQLAWLRPDLGFTALRGNIATRLSKVPTGGAVVVAHAALERLDLQPSIVEVLAEEEMLPQVGQGALALRCRAGDGRTLDRIQRIDDPDAHRALLAERAMLAYLGGGCDAPVGALARIEGATGRVRVEGLLASRDGHGIIRRVQFGRDPEAAGAELGAALLDAGGRAFLGEGPAGEAR